MSFLSESIPPTSAGTETRLFAKLQREYLLNPLGHVASCILVQFYLERWSAISHAMLATENSSSVSSAAVRPRIRSRIVPKHNPAAGLKLFRAHAIKHFYIGIAWLLGCGVL